MRREQLESLSVDELAMLWIALNKTAPPILGGLEIEPELFCAVNHVAILRRIDNIDSNLKEKHNELIESLKQKLAN